MRQNKPNTSFGRAVAQSSSLILLILLAYGCGARVESAVATKESPPPKLVKIGNVNGISMDAESQRLAGISTQAVGTGDLSTSVQPTGEVAPTDSGTVQITPRLAGKIVAARVGVGDRVKKGDVIAEVDSVDLAEAEVTYQTAVSKANLARNQLEQQKKLVGYGAVSEQAVEDARKASIAADAAVATDEAQIKVDKLALSSTKQLVEMGEITRKPLEDAQNAYAQAQSEASQAHSNLHTTKANYDRAVILFDGGIYSRQQLEDAENAYNSAKAADGQLATAERLARQELTRQETIYNRNLNGAGSLQEAQSKVQQDQHLYQNDLVAQELAHRQYQRALAIRKSGIPVSQALQSAQDAYEEARIALEGAANTLKMYGIRPSNALRGLQNGRVVVPIVSPIDGIVAARNMAVGQNTDTSQVLARIVNLDRVYIDAQIYEKDIQGVLVGDHVNVHVAAFPARSFGGKVQLVAHEVNPETRTVLVRTILNNPGWSLRPGMFASVVIGSSRPNRAISIPTDAIMQEDEKQIVYVRVSAGQFVKRTIKVGSPVGGRTPVEVGLEPGEEVVVGGNVLLQRAQQQLENGAGG